MKPCLEGTLTLTLTSADPAAAISAITGSGIRISDVMTVGTLQIRLTVSRKDYLALAALAEKRGETIHPDTKAGLYWKLRQFVKRPVLVAGLLLLFAFTCFLPTRVLFIRVEGNTQLPANLILEQAELCGIRFGASRSEVRSEKMKNALLQAIPQLQWAGINTSGCVATISVTERSEEDTGEDCESVCHVVASRDGIVTSATATQGSLLCKVGQAVQKGQILVSGYTDCGLHIRAECAEGEIFAQTTRQISAVTPVQRTEKGTVTGESKKYALQIGKFRINFYKDSGILDTTCDKMYLYQYLTLPGGFQLPVALITEKTISYETETIQRSDADMEAVLNPFCDAYLRQQMIAGQILQRNGTIQQSDGSCGLIADYVCLEMISQVKQEENFTQYGEND